MKINYQGLRETRILVTGMLLSYLLTIIGEEINKLIGIDFGSYLIIIFILGFLITHGIDYDIIKKDKSK